MTPEIEAQRVLTRLKRRSPEERTLDQILAEARAEGRQVFVLDDDGIVEIVGGSPCRS